MGFGFVIRGDGPCYVQAIDPAGPAAVAGLKVTRFLSFSWQLGRGVGSKILDIMTFTTVVV